MNWSGLERVRDYRKVARWNRKKKRNQRIARSNDLSAKIKLYSQQQLSTPTKAELKLWKYLKLKGFKFQAPITIKKKYFYILDFYHQAAKLGIEVDGGYHNTDTQKTKDSARDSNLNTQKGITILRFTNDEVVKDINKVIDEVQSMVDVSLRRIRCKYDTLIDPCRTGSHRLLSDGKDKNGRSSKNSFNLINSGTNNYTNSLLN